MKDTKARGTKRKVEGRRDKHRVGEAERARESERRRRHGKQNGVRRKR